MAGRLPDPLAAQVAVLISRVDVLTVEIDKSRVARHELNNYILRLTGDLETWKAVEDERHQEHKRQHEEWATALKEFEEARSSVKGGVSVIRWFWAGIAALLLIGIDAIVRGYFH